MVFVGIFVVYFGGFGCLWLVFYCLSVVPCPFLNMTVYAVCGVNCSF